ncbi:MAG: dihydropteroate synthase [Limnospira sp. PMC 1291.21]|uniref:dihydropteroate synthase n=1 Tax=unclassified Limnospira TaxID=2642885 RepID=UPI0028E16A4A|nr:MULTISPECIES: dihydropteroate synthase [unclassified Limnospira]MDT9177788.1 dihydropteroate synthase [Limnospira sp. PMC 1238.20]MDT9193118.1 dihydropteroate synthase [Limnospira sp. PMC 1245.20]MDT9203352.1 dihydropteroate synthase [Limnospira sp. PMC 1243.20]MDT9208553.1 dihydropteroate synthase [Limnospira sp. PMC 1252.20]MDT9213774.1 dihydropteroate synthase [Limnospira sp. PMC 1256.20]
MIKPITIRGHSFDWGSRTYLMGILNVTPDSFSDGGAFDSLDAALVRAGDMVRAGADIIDVGGVSTRPGAEVVSLETELERVLPVVAGLRQLGDMVISVDTTRATVAEAAVGCGADIINDISGGIYDPDMLSVVADLGVPVVLMHLRGTPQTMQTLTDYGDLMGEIKGFLAERLAAGMAAGIPAEYMIVDPGIGFAKTLEQNLQILRELPLLKDLDCPLLVGPSRKSFIGKILDKPHPQGRVWGTAAACVAAIANSADILRIHDVPQLVDVARVADAIYRPA